MRGFKSIKSINLEVLKIKDTTIVPSSKINNKLADIFLDTTVIGRD